MAANDDANNMTINDGKESDYGSDFGTDDEATLSVLLTQVGSQPSTPLVEDAAILALHAPSYSVFARGVRRKYVDEEGVVFEMESQDGPIGEPSVEIEYDEPNRSTFSRKTCTFSRSLITR